MMLPIETRSSDATTTEYKRYPDEWNTVTFDVDNNDSMVAAFKEVSTYLPAYSLTGWQWNFGDPASLQQNQSTQSLQQMSTEQLRSLLK